MNTTPDGYNGLKLIIIEGITRIDKVTRQIIFEAWPLYADPEFPQTGGPYPDWPITIAQTDNDGRTPLLEAARGGRLSALEALLAHAA